MDWQKSFAGWGSASITAVGSVAAAAIVACAAYGAARAGWMAPARSTVVAPVGIAEDAGVELPG